MESKKKKQNFPGKKEIFAVVSLPFIKMPSSVFSFSTAIRQNFMKQSFPHVSFWCIFSVFYESQSDTCLPIHCTRTLEIQISFLYPTPGAKLLNRKYCSAQHCKGYATFLNLCLFIANVLHLTAKKESKSKENLMLMKLKVINSKVFKHSMHGTCTFRGFFCLGHYKQLQVLRTRCHLTNKLFNTSNQQTI